MTGRGRGRGTLAKWEASKSVGEDSFRSRDSDVSACSKENWEDEVTLDKQNKPRDNSDIRVTHVIDVEHFWAQVGSPEELKQFDKYMDALNAWCDQQIQPLKAQHNIMPVCGQPVCVKHTDTNQWRRAQVTRLSNSMVDVFYLDYGQVECVPSERLCSSTPSDFMSRPALAQYITLEGVQPVNGKWSDEANDRFSELVSSGKTLTVHLSDSCRGKLFLRNSRGQDISVGDILVSEGHAKSCSESFNRRLWEPNTSSGTQETRWLETEKQDKLDQQWSAVTINPPASWKAHKAIPTVQEVESYYTSKHIKTDKLFSSKEKSLSGGTTSGHTSFQPVFSPPLFRAHHELSAKKDTSEIPSTGVPTPSNLESGKLETFKKSEQVATEAVRTAKPYLASPKEFLSHLRGPEKQVPKGDLLEPKNELQPKYPQPHIRNPLAKNKETSSTIEPKNMQDSPAEMLTKVFSNPDQNLQRSSQSVTASSSSSSVATSSSLPQTVHPPYSSFTFWPKPGRGNIAAQFQSSVFNKDNTLTLQLGPNPNVPQQTEFIKTQPSSDNTRDKAWKAEVEWKVWKFQRNIRGILNRMALGNDKNVFQELEKMVVESRLSQNFPGISEVFVVLELLVERVLDKGQFDDVAVKVLIMFRDLNLPQLSDHVSKALRRGQQELIEQCDVSDCHKKWQRFSFFLGRLYLEVLNEVEPAGLKSAVDAFVANSLHNWMSFDQAELETLHELKAISLKSFLKVIGPTIDQIEGNEISRYFTTIRNLVLSRDLAQKVKSILLDTLLLRAAKWTPEDDTDEQETGSLSPEDEVYVEKEKDNNDDDDDDDNDDGGDDDDVEIEDDDEGEEWDPYFKVKAMLMSLKLEDLLPKFFENCIRDSLLSADWEELKRTLQEASFPPGVILEIRMYLDKRLLGKEAAGGSKKAPRTKGRERRNDSSTPTISVDHSIEINKLTNELQQLMSRDNKDSTGASSATVRKISPQREPAGHEGTPYSRGGARKFVSRAERRRSSETLSEDMPSALTSSLSRGPESVGPPSVALADPMEFGTSSAAVPGKQSATTMSYSAALKTSPPEVAKSGTPSDSKSKTLSRPPPGLSPLPIHGGDTEMHMTVLGGKTKARPSGGVGGTRRKSPTPADVSLNWRSDKVNEHGFQASVPRASSPASGSGQGLKWRRFDEASLGKPRSGNSSNSAPRRDESAESPVAQPHRTFGPGGLKACVICGSKDHLRCHNRSMLFLD